MAQSAAHAKRFATIVSARRLRDNASAKMLSDCASVPHQHLSLVQSLFTAPVLVNSNAPKVSPELELKLSKIMAETKVLADGYSGSNASSKFRALLNTREFSCIAVCPEL